MGTIIPRKRRDGSTAYLAQISLMQQGRTHRESKTFDREPAARAWIKKREKALEDAEAWGRTASSRSATLGQAIDRYVLESAQIGKTKRQVLNTLRKHSIADLRCEMVTSETLADLIKELKQDRSASTVSNYLSHLGAVFAIAKPAWGYQLDETAIDAAKKVAKRLGHTGKSRQRDRRPTLDEMNRLMDHFGGIRVRRPSSIPMQQITAFALFSTRRQEEITRITWDDFDEQTSTVVVRDMKNPGEKLGNDVRCELPPEAVRIINSMPQLADEIFPFTTDAISAAMTRACRLLDIDDLHFHDLRHEGISRLFEMGKTIPQAAAVSGHRSWSSLKRYAHLRGVGDRWAGWTWLSEIATPPAASGA